LQLQLDKRNKKDLNSRLTDLSKHWISEEPSRIAGGLWRKIFRRPDAIVVTQSTMGDFHKKIRIST